MDDVKKATDLISVLDLVIKELQTITEELEAKQLELVSTVKHNDETDKTIYEYIENLGKQAQIKNDIETARSLIRLLDIAAKHSGYFDDWRFIYQ